MKRFAFPLIVLTLALSMAAGVAAQVSPPSGGGAGVTWKGAYNGATNYKAGELVSYGGAAYLCHVASPAGTLPTDTTKWAKLGSTGTIPTKLLDAALADVTTADPTRGDVLTAQGASPTWAPLAKGAAGSVLTMGADESSWVLPGTFETTLAAQTLLAPTNLVAVCDPGGVSGVTVDRYFQLATVDAAANSSLPGLEDSVIACPDDSTITLTWTPAAGAAGVDVYWDTAMGAKSRKYVDISEDPSLTTITFTILSGAASPNLDDDSAAGASLPTTADGRGFFYDFWSGLAVGSTGWFTDLYVANGLWLNAGSTRLRAGDGVPSATCFIGDTYQRTDGAANTAGYVCTAANTWSPLLNTASITDAIYIPAAYCYANNTCTQTTDWDWNGLDSGLPTFSMIASGRTAKGTADYSDVAVKHMQTSRQIPTTWDGGTVTLTVHWLANVANAALSVVWQAKTACSTAGDNLQTAFNAAATVTSAAHGTALVLRQGTINLDMTGCVAGDMLGIDLIRDPTHASDDLAATAQVIGVTLGWTR